MLTPKSATKLDSAPAEVLRLEGRAASGGVLRNDFTGTKSGRTYYRVTLLDGEVEWYAGPEREEQSN